MNISQNSKDFPVSCPNMIRLHNNCTDGVDIMDQKTAAYRLDRKSKYWLYLRMFIDLMYVTDINCHIVYMKLGDGISLLTFTNVVAKALIGRYSNRNRSFPNSRSGK